MNSESLEKTQNGTARRSLLFLVCLIVFALTVLVGTELYQLHMRSLIAYAYVLDEMALSGFVSVVLFAVSIVLGTFGIVRLREMNDLRKRSSLIAVVLYFAHLPLWVVGVGFSPPKYIIIAVCSQFGLLGGSICYGLFSRQAPGFRAACASGLAMMSYAELLLWPVGLR